MSNNKAKKKHDWDRAYIVAELHVNGWSIRKLSTHHGYKDPTTLSQALNRHWPKGERLIAEAISKRPCQIWPSRYPMGDSTTNDLLSPLEVRQTGKEAA